MGATGTEATRLVFLLWYVLAVVVLLNSVASFVLEALGAQLHQSQRNKVGEGGSAPLAARRQLDTDREENEIDALRRKISVRRRTSQGRVLLPPERLMSALFDSDTEEPSEQDIEEHLEQHLSGSYRRSASLLSSHSISSS